MTTLFVATMMVMCPCHGQDNPFGDNPFGGSSSSDDAGGANPFGGNPFGGNPFGGSDAASPGTSPAGPSRPADAALPAANADLPAPFEVTLDNARSTEALVVRSIRRTNPQTPQQLAQAVAKLVAIESWGDAGLYLSRLNAAKLDDAQLFELYRQQGPNFFYTLHSIDELRPVAQTLARKVLSAAKRHSQTPERMNQLVEQLADPDINTRSAALSQLTRVGEPAYAAMLEAFAIEDEAKRKRIAPGVRGGLRRIGDAGAEVFMAGATSGHAAIARESWNALATLDTPAANQLISVLYLAPDTPDSLRNMAATSIQKRYRYLPDPTTIKNQIMQSISRDLGGSPGGRSQPGTMGRIDRVYAGSGVDERTELVWHFDAASKKFQSLPVTEAVAERLRVARLAKLMQELPAGDSRSNQLLQLSMLEAAKLKSGPVAGVDTTALMNDLGQPSSWQLDRLLRESLRRDLVPASIAVCELLKQSTDASVLNSGQGRSALVDALLSGHRLIQVAALEAVAKLDPRSAWSGSSYAIDVASFMARSQGNGRVLAGTRLASDLTSFSGVISATGRRVKTVHSGHAFFNAAVGSPDWDLLVVTDNLMRPNYNQLIQSLRNDWRTKHVPIALAVSDIAQMPVARRLARNDPLLTIIELNYDPTIVARQLDRIQQRRSAWDQDDAGRVAQSAVATQWLADLSSEPDTYAFYNVHKFEDVIYNLLNTGDDVPGATGILSGLGTPMAQRKLLDFASQNGIAMEERRLAAEGFSKSVDQFGLLLTTSEIQRQYDRYNESEGQPAESTQLLGSLLDAVEKNAVRNKQVVR